jgi:hypothetical protein
MKKGLRRAIVSADQIIGGTLSRRGGRNLASLEVEAYLLV